MDPAFLANFALFVALAMSQFGGLDLFGGDGDTGTDTGTTGPAPAEPGGDPAPLDPAAYDPARYSDEITGTDGDDSFASDTSGSNKAYFLGPGNDTLDASLANDYAEGARAMTR